MRDELFSGSGPEGDEGFASLRKLGVRTVLSVDGARPDLPRAHRQGLRYVHIPIGYGGITEGQALRIARAVRGLPGPVYIHCHHGKHRGPAAAAVARRCLDDSFTADRARAWLRRAGTDPRYAGLFHAAAALRRPTKEDLDRVPADFPEAADVGGMARLMVEVDQRWDHLQGARKAGWKAPPQHPDIDPPHEAVQLAELYREAVRLPELATGSGKEMRGLLGEAEEGARTLEGILRGNGGKGVNGEAAEKAIRQAGAACTRCHGRHRDVRQSR